MQKQTIGCHSVVAVLLATVCRFRYGHHSRRSGNQENAMKTVDRRTILSSGALALASAATSTPAVAQTGSKPIFSLPAITIPIVGEEGSFPVRRIYCIGRNYAAHAIERGS